MTPMNFIAVRAFACPDCGIQVLVTRIAYRDNGHIYLVGYCPKCPDSRNKVAIDLNEAVAAIIKAREVSAN